MTKTIDNKYEKCGDMKQLNEPKTNGLREILEHVAMEGYEPAVETKFCEDVMSEAEQQIKKHFKKEYAKRLLSGQSLWNIINDNCRFSSNRNHVLKCAIYQLVNKISDEQKRKVESD